MTDEIMTVQEVADYLRISRTTAWRWCNEGRLPAFRIGREWRIKR
ncbi:MAG: DNA-binding protein, partial [Chloroflexi bacterium]